VSAPAGSSRSVEITLNGVPFHAERELTIAELIVRLGMNAQLVAVEVNRSLVRRGTFEKVRVTAGDQVEIVEFVGGG
jgi:sulfur carrier protein